MKPILKEFNFERDVMRIDDIFKRQPELGVPSLNNVIANASIIDEESGKLIGYGVIKLFAEGVLILDHSVSKKDKAKSVKIALDKCIQSAKDAGLEYLYVISNMDSYTAVLRNRFGFSECTGALLMKDLRDKEN
jgi:N-acetylglutamate synthase-like GNAT family acetyltransferase